jgi:hypothetical protein
VLGLMDMVSRLDCCFGIGANLVRDGHYFHLCSGVGDVDFGEGVGGDGVAGMFPGWEG